MQKEIKFMSINQISNDLFHICDYLRKRELVDDRLKTHNFKVYRMSAFVGDHNIKKCKKYDITPITIDTLKVNDIRYKKIFIKNGQDILNWAAKAKADLFHYACEGEQKASDLFDIIKSVEIGLAGKELTSEEVAEYNTIVEE